MIINLTKIDIIGLSTLDIILNSITNNMAQFDHFKSILLGRKAKVQAWCFLRGSQ